VRSKLASSAGAAAWLALACAPPRPLPSAPSPAVAVRASHAAPIPSSGAPIPSPQAPPQVDYRARLTAFYGSLGDASQRREAYRALFAPQLTRFIGLRNVSRERASATADAFFSTKRNLRYGLQGEPRVTREADVTHVTARVSAYYEAPVPKSWPELVPELGEATITTMAELEVQLDADRDGAVTSYIERDAGLHRRMRVAIKTRGYELPFVDGCWQPPSADLASVELPVGTLLEATHESVLIDGCGPGTSVLHLRLHGRDWWVLLALYELMPNPNGGSSTGGTTFLDWAD
jgi:hypothetical protein